MRVKSVSVQNFEHLVKQIIDGAQQGNGQMMEVHQMIYERWRFDKLSEPRNTESRGSSTKQQESSQQSISATVAHRRSRRPKYKRPSLDDEAIRDTVEGEQLKTLQVPNFLSCDNKKSTSVNSQENLKNLRDVCFAPATTPTANVIEIWSKSLNQSHDLPQAKKKKKKNNVAEEKHEPSRNCRLPNPKQREEDLTFNAWKKKKNFMYHRVLREMKAEQQQKLLENQAKMEHRKAFQQVLRTREQEKNQRNQKFCHKKNLEIMEQANPLIKSSCNRSNEREYNRQCVPDLPVEKTRTVVDKKRRTTMSTRQLPDDENNNRRRKTVATNDPVESIAFHSILNRLNWILYNKYLRERRHLVRSFYCQPFYYGDANVCMTT